MQRPRMFLCTACARCGWFPPILFLSTNTLWKREYFTCSRLFSLACDRKGFQSSACGCPTFLGRPSLRGLAMIDRSTTVLRMYLSGARSTAPHSLAPAPRGRIHCPAFTQPYQCQTAGRILAGFDMFRTGYRDLSLQC